LLLLGRPDFLQWAGFNIVATFDSAASLTPQVVKDLVDKGKANGVTLVIIITGQ